MNDSFVFPENLRGMRIHFTGVKGTGMAAFAEICVSRGAFVTGSDVSERFYTDEILERIGVSVLHFDVANIIPELDFVVYSSAYKTDKNSELIRAQSLNLPIIKYTDALGAFSAAAYSCGIAGVHGKTTVTALTGSLLKNLSFPAQVLAGSAVSSFGGSCILDLGHDYFVAETCEYQRHFMSFYPKKIVLTSVESDHQDFYPTYESILGAFVDYALLLPQNGQLIYCADDKGACEAAFAAKKKRSDIELVAYGENAEGLWKVTFGSIGNGSQSFSLAAFKRSFLVRFPGHHTVLNCAAAAALAGELHKTAYGTLPDEQKFAAGFMDFAGSKRRSEIMGEVRGVLFMDDYAHHPTAIQTTLAGLRAFYPGRRLIADFMPHTYSRTAALLDRFANSFESADEVILHKIYASAREVNDSLVDGRLLFEKTAAVHSSVRYFEELSDAKPYLRENLKPSDIFITLGAGDNWKLGQEIMHEFSDSGFCEK